MQIGVNHKKRNCIKYWRLWWLWLRAICLRWSSPLPSYWIALGLISNCQQEVWKETLHGLTDEERCYQCWCQRVYSFYILQSTVHCVQGLTFFPYLQLFFVSIDHKTTEMCKSKHLKGRLGPRAINVTFFSIMEVSWAPGLVTYRFFLIMEAGWGPV